nr:MAG TPA: HNH endonuclease bacteriophage, HNH Endonuclease, DNA.52A [Caudoviricetes sp.]
MAWTTSTRKQRLPNNWNKIRQQVLQRNNNKCAGLPRPTGTPTQMATGTTTPTGRWHAAGCNRHATDVDHITPGDNHSIDNLQPLSRACHHAKTTAETLARTAARHAMTQHKHAPHPNTQQTQNKNKTKRNEEKPNETRSRNLRERFT